MTEPTPSTPSRDSRAEPRTEAGRALFPGLNVAQEFAAATLADIHSNDWYDGYGEGQKAAASTLRPEDGLAEAWAEAEAALPKGWIVAGVSHVGPSPMMRREFVADAWSSWHRSSRSVDSLSGYGPTPAAALRALRAALTEPDAEETR